ncbi:MAG: hypothetical protein H6912_05875 [Kordiimonadaceae bacterium]|nr:hypothetical protein [Kordiimonadaceae bacterium]
MPLEIKHIYFTEAELKKALINFSVLKKQFFEAEDIKEIIIDKAKALRVIFKVDPSLGLEDNKITYTHAEVAAALFAFCMVSKIPLPRRGVKELHANDEKVYLTITLEEDVQFEKYVISNVLKNSSNVKK